MMLRRVSLVAIFLVVFVFQAIVANEEDLALLAAPRHYSDFKLLTILHHGSLEERSIFQEANVEDQFPRIFRSVAHFRKLRERLNPRDNDGEVDPFGAEMEVPDPRNKETVLNLADMSYNAYENRNSSLNWRPVPGYNLTAEFGWSDRGLQGYVFGNSDRSVLVIAFKGTTFKFFGEGGTSENDRLMDNLMFSCCCAMVDSSWTPVCGCQTGEKTCSNSCLTQRLSAPDTYYSIAQEVFLRVRTLYPTSQIWFTGHSLGGSLASLLAARNNLPAFAYEAPGELLYAQRVGLKIDTSNMQKYNIYHFGNDADPIYLGTCQGKLSTCYQFHYAMETQCHIGNTCTYDGGLVTNINNHRLEVCINRFYLPDPVPTCVPENNCRDCTNWIFS